jgi:hypothetical protein
LRLRVPEIVLGFLLATAFWSMVAIVYPKYHGADHEATKDTPHVVAEVDTNERIANYNEALAWLTAFLVFANIALWLTTLRSGVSQSREMEASITVAQKTADIAREALVKTERAFVYLEDFDTSPVFGRRGSVDAHHTGWEVRQYVVRPRWRNNGNTPTRDMTVRVNWTPWVGDLPAEFAYKYGEDAKAAPMFLGPKAREWSDAVRFAAHEATGVLEGRQSIFIWGRCDYRDVFGQPHHTRWCYRLIFTRTAPDPQSQFVAFGPYNGSDEDGSDDAQRA